MKTARQKKERERGREREREKEKERERGGGGGRERAKEERRSMNHSKREQNIFNKSASQHITCIQKCHRLITYGYLNSQI